MRIALLGQHVSDAIGGAEVQIDIIAKKLIARGHSVCYMIKNPKSNDYSSLSYPHKILNRPYTISLNRALNEFKPEVLYWRAGRSNLLLTSVISRLKSIKFFFAIAHVKETKMFHFDLFKRRKSFPANLKQFSADFINYFGYYFVNLVFVQSDDFIGSVPVKQFIKVYNSMEVPLGNFSWNRPYIFWVASLKQAKNPEKCLTIAESISHLNVDVLMAGNIKDPEYDYFQYKEKLPKNLYYLGPMDIKDVNSAISSSQFLIHTCAPEGFCNNLIQAWLLGKPTISEFYDPESTITNNNLGKVSGTDTQFKLDVINLLQNPEAIKESGNRAMALAKIRFNPKTNIAKIENGFIQVLKAKK